MEKEIVDLSLCDPKYGPTRRSTSWGEGPTNNRRRWRAGSGAREGRPAP